MKTKPIRPNEVDHLKNIPDEVFEVFNQMIAENIRGNEAVLRQDEIVKRLVDIGFDRRELFDKGWLDVEDAYRAAGWKVEYDKPAYCETYEPTFTFRKK